MKIFIAFTDSTQTTIGSVFSCAQDPGIWSNQGTIDETDARWKTYCDSLPICMQEGLPSPSSE